MVRNVEGNEIIYTSSGGVRACLGGGERSEASYYSVTMYVEGDGQIYGVDTKGGRD